MGIGGAPEGVLAAAALKCLGGGFMGRLKPRNDEEADRAEAMGFGDLDRVLELDDLVKGERHRSSPRPASPTATSCAASASSATKRARIRF